MLDINDAKVAIASIGGLGNWLLEIDMVLKVGISLASLFYIVMKCAELIDKRKK